MYQFVQGPLSVLGRLLLATIFFMAAVGNKIPHFSEVAKVMESAGVPAPHLLLQLFPFALVVCVALFVLVHKFVGGYSKNKALYFGAGAVCIIILTVTSMCVHVRTSQNRQAQGEHREDRTNLAEIPQGFSDIKEEFRNLGALVTNPATSHMTDQDKAEIAEAVKLTLANLDQNKNNTNFFDLRRPGFSILMVLKLGNPIHGRDNFIFDCGQNVESNRISIFLDSNTNLCFSVTDREAKPLVIKVRPALDTFQLGSLFYFLCEYGSVQDFSSVRMVINGMEVAEINQTTPIIMSYPVIVGTMVLSSNLNHQNGGVFGADTIAVFHETVDNANAKKLVHYFGTNIDINERKVSFFGSQWLQKSFGRNSLDNPFTNSQPINL